MAGRGDSRIFQAQRMFPGEDQMAELFGMERSIITKRLRNVSKEGELEEAAVRAKFTHTASNTRSLAGRLK
jgi:hypothetical protein